MNSHRIAPGRGRETNTRLSGWSQEEGGMTSLSANQFLKKDLEDRCFACTSATGQDA